VAFCGIEWLRQVLGVALLVIGLCSTEALPMGVTSMLMVLLTAP